MKSTRALKATGLVLVAVVLGLLTVQGSYALWNKFAGANAGTVQAADFRISLTDTKTGDYTDMTLANGTAATFALSTTPTGAVVPGHSTYAGVQLGNVTNAGGDFTVRATTAVPVIDNNAVSALAPYMQVKVVAATALSQCSQAALYESASSNGTATVDIAKTATGVFCFQITLAATMPVNLSGQTAAIAVPITVNQL
ncbi:hypothetical protein [Arthrobacter glacialis]|uniref:SipW-cognate class signal peptide n=1 Tax=Arthrobacter glacialis TaxID=1664 RepID=A0A2S4A1C1_ARTGL|nr:hypothetical protein [Arthrobacter glacialis]POH74917.1 hypothetical protein CVS27_03390 [Arthrobacter glacialis]